MIGLIRNEDYKVIDRISNPKKEWVLDKLDNEICLVVFKKKSNGQFRSLKCTRNLKLLPRKHKPRYNEIIENPHGYDDIIPVWDIFTREWKSFYNNSILSISVLLGEHIKLQKD